MSDIQSDAPERVLHIHRSAPELEGATGLSVAVDAHLRSVLPTVYSSDNVYDALARLCAPDARSFRAAVVSMDCVGASEMEFFTLLSRMCKDLAIYVYGGNRHEERIATAIELGAKGRATEDALRALAVDADPVPAMTTDDSAPPDPLQAPDEPLPVVVTEDFEEEEPLDDWTSEAEDDTAEVEETETNDQPIRVPWLQYSGSPARKAPSRGAPVAPPTGEEASDQDMNAAFDPHAPLLTDAELQALIGDDIATIAPPTPSDPGPTGSVNGERPA